MKELKVVCVCDLAITQDVMRPIKAIEKHGAEVLLFDDKQMQTSTDITRVMLKTEKDGADSCSANAELFPLMEKAEILVVHASPVNSQLLEYAKELKLVVVLRGGVDNVNLDACRDKGIKVINAPGRSANAVADFTVGMILAEAKNIARGHKALYENKWLKDFPNQNYCHDLWTRTVGIVGFGEVGRRVVKRLSGFECKILIHDPFIVGDSPSIEGCEFVSLEELFKESDFLSLHLRLSEKTANFIGEKELSAMKPTAYLINTARSGLIDEPALISALRSKSIGGAAIDVFEQEPLSVGSPYLELDNVTITPHLAGTSCDTFANSVHIVVDDLARFFEGKTMKNVVC